MSNQPGRIRMNYIYRFAFRFRSEYRRALSGFSIGRRRRVTRFLL